MRVGDRMVALAVDIHDTSSQDSKNHNFKHPPAMSMEEYSIPWNAPDEPHQGSSRVPPRSNRVPLHYLPNQETHEETPRFLLRGKYTQDPLRQSQQLQEPIFVSHGCLLLPVFLAAWWYYTKKCFRRVTGFIRDKPEPEVDPTEKFHDKFFRFDDAYIGWDDILDDTKDGTRSDRFVKWINRRNVRRRQATREVRLATKRTLNISQSEGGDDSSQRYGGFSSLDSYDSLRCYVEPLTNPAASMQWECLSDAGDMELCAMNSSVAEGEDSIVTMGSLRRMFSDEDLKQARSMPTLAEALSYVSAQEDGMTVPFDEGSLKSLT